MKDVSLNLSAWIWNDHIHLFINDEKHSIQPLPRHGTLRIDLTDGSAPGHPAVHVRRSRMGFGLVSCSFSTSGRHVRMLEQDSRASHVPV
ncbi:hypothetical protein ACFWBC_38480 [Streptomyces sp. NPDC059985]|uniref:hypothetical protein n=1 Tax=Streptomyces sp. NPDC059985 TaxID=3347025 RepID=UPI0036A5029F